MPTVHRARLASSSHQRRSFGLPDRRHATTTLAMARPVTAKKNVYEMAMPSSGTRMSAATWAAMMVAATTGYFMASLPPPATQ